MNDLRKLHKAANNTLLGRLHSGLLGLRGSAGDLSKAAEALAERASVPGDTAGAADAGRDCGGCAGTQGEGVEV